MSKVRVLFADSDRHQSQDDTVLAGPATSPGRSASQWAWVTTCFALVVTCLVQSARAEDEEYYELMRIFVDTFEQIDRNYVKEVDRRELVEAAVRGMLSELDPYSNYISPDDINRFTEDVEQEFGGIGIQVQYRPDQGLIVTTPLPGSPAYNAGVLAGDVIVEIEGQKVAEFPERRQLETAVKLLKGKPGVEVTVGVRHVGKEEVVTIPITREVIQLKTVLGDTYNSDGSWNFMYDEESKIGYIRITHFSRRTGEELRDALRELKSQNIAGMILDLRFNPGGLLTAAVEVADLFVESGKIVSTEGRNSPNRVWSAKRFGTYTGFPMAVLINHYSASASEIVSAALQDHHRAVVIGERSWGKGSVQNVIELEEGDSALKLTTASYHRPSGKNIHRFPNAKDDEEWGVVPDDGYDVEFDAQQQRDYWRYRQDRDVINTEGPPESEFEDTQLERAVDYIQAAIRGEMPEAEKKDEDEKPDAKKDESDAAAKLPLLIRQIPTAAA